jgi:hypothetical protein
VTCHSTFGPLPIGGTSILRDPIGTVHLSIDLRTTPQEP